MLAYKMTTKRSLHTTQVFKLRKAIEHLYYFSLMTGTPNYASNEKIWLSWVKMGFDTSLREGPPGINPDSRIRIETQVEPRYTTIVGDAPDAKALASVQTILARLEATKATFQGKDDAARLGVFLADREIGQELLNPLVAVLANQKALRPDESKRLVQAAQDAVVYLTDNDVTSFSTSTV